MSKLERQAQGEPITWAEGEWKAPKNEVLVELHRMISLRDFREEDIPRVLNYWFHSPEGFIESLGVDKTRMQQKSEMEKSLAEKCRANSLLPKSKQTGLVILYQEKAIGIHTLYPIIENESGVFHAHIWQPEMRRCGIGMHSYPLACRIFLERFQLKRILFKTPLQNIGAIRVKEKLGIRSIGEEVIDFGVLKEGTRTKVFELTREEMDIKFPLSVT